MSIPKFRYVKYADDGCNIYQCLNCYNSIEGRFNPKDWKHCPYCGIEWEGEHKWLFHDDNGDIIKPERYRKDHKVISYDIRCSMELQEQSLFKRTDDTYKSLNSPHTWSSIYYSDNLFKSHFGCESSKDYKEISVNYWLDLRDSLSKKYGYKYGDYVFYFVSVKPLLRSSSGKQFVFPKP